MSFLLVSMATSLRMLSRFNMVEPNCPSSEGETVHSSCLIDLWNDYTLRKERRRKERRRRRRRRKRRGGRGREVGRRGRRGRYIGEEKNRR